MAERFSRLVRDHLDTAIRARGKLGDEVIDERIDILWPRTERRDRDRKYIQAVVKIVTEASLIDHHGEVPIRRGDQTDVDVDRPGSPETLELVFLQHAQELRLQLERNLATSSRKIVPPSASSNRPILCAIAPVNAPRS